MFSDRLYQGLAIALTITMVIGWLFAYYYHREAESLKKDLYSLNSVVKIIGEDINKKASELPKEIEKVRTVYKTKIEYIDKWRADENKTNCQNAIDFGRDYKPSSLLY